MVVRVELGDAEAHLGDYLDRAARTGERIVVERDGQPVAALVSVEDLARLERDGPPPVAAPSLSPEEAAFRRRMEEAGLVVQWSPRRPVPLSERKLIQAEGQPLSEQIIADRR